MLFYERWYPPFRFVTYALMGSQRASPRWMSSFRHSVTPQAASCSSSLLSKMLEIGHILPLKLGVADAMAACNTS